MRRFQMSCAQDYQMPFFGTRIPVYAIVICCIFDVLVHFQLLLYSWQSRIAGYIIFYVTCHCLNAAVRVMCKLAESAAP